MKKTKIFNYIAVGILFVLAYTIYIVCYWVSNTFGVGLDEIIFTLTSPLKGSDNSTLVQALTTCLPRIFLVLAVYVLLVIVDVRTKVSIYLTAQFKKTRRLDVRKWARRLVAVLSVAALVASLLLVQQEYQVVEYINERLHSSTLYEEYYVDPENANIVLGTPDGEYQI